jgi:hypothetical protein
MRYVTSESLNAVKSTKALCKAAAGVGLAMSLSGCLLTLPYWNQSFNNHTDAVRVQAWTDYSGNPIRIQCSPAHHGGLYQPFGQPTWTLVEAITPTTPGVVDSDGFTIYSVSRNLPLPAACWRQDPSNSIWYTALRARQRAPNPFSGEMEGRIFDTHDRAGLECLGRSVGNKASWLGYAGERCQLTSSGSTIKHVIIHADS